MHDQSLQAPRLPPEGKSIVTTTAIAPASTKPATEFKIFSGEELEKRRQELLPKVTSEVRSLLRENAGQVLDRPVNPGVSDKYSKFCFSVLRDVERVIDLLEVRALLAETVRTVGMKFILDSVTGYYLQLLTSDVPDDATPKRLKDTRAALKFVVNKKPISYTSVGDIPQQRRDASAAAQPAPKRRDSNGWNKPRQLTPVQMEQTLAGIEATPGKIGTPNTQATRPSSTGSTLPGGKNSRKNKRKK